MLLINQSKAKTAEGHNLHEESASTDRAHKFTKGISRIIQNFPNRKMESIH